MRYWIVICALTVSTSAVATPFSEGLAVETKSPDALCPDLATTREAIHNRLGTLALGGEQQGWIARYTVGHAPGEQGDFVRLELLDPAGTPRLLRDLPQKGESCATLSQAIALVVERYFRELAPEETVTTAANASGAPDRSVRAAPPDLRTPRWAFGLGFGAASAQPGAIAEAEVGTWLLANVHAQFALFADLGAHTEQLGAAELELRSFPAELSLGLGEHGQVWDFFAGPEARWSLETVHSTLPHSLDSGPGAAFAVGGAGGVSWWPGGAAFGLSVRGSLDYALAGTKFRVEMADNTFKPVLELPKVQGLVTLGIIFGSRP